MTLPHSPLQRPPERVLILHNPLVARSAALAAEMHAYLSSQAGLSVQQAVLGEAEDGAGVAGQDLIVLLGGDGSMLRAGALAARHGVPLLGINLGRLGFLGEVPPEEWREALGRVLAGDCWLEARMLLHVEHHRAGQVLGSYEALNEAVVGRGALARPVRLKALIDGGELTTYVADGLIIATPTGSTAYALAAGGPVLPPELRNILLIAIAPHLSIDRAIVLPQGSTVEVIVRTDHQAILSADGQYEVPLADGDAVRVCMSQFTVNFVRVRPRHYFYTSLVQRMQQNPSADKVSK
ncbi:MAG: NAD(+)/NADH kinase [Anaerolineales bacterium]|nr:NAD(+)/NADH kinase [Anaerolineales bacterium]